MFYCKKVNRIFIILFFIYSLMLCKYSHGASQEEAQLYKLGLAIETSLNKGDTTTFNSFFDFNTLAHRSLDYTVFERKYQKDQFIKGFVKGAYQIGERLIQAINTNNGYAKFLRIKNREYKNTLLIRLDLGDAGFEYMEFYPKKSVNGEYKIIDWYQLSTGEMFSITMGAMSKLMVDPSPNLVQKLLRVKAVDSSVVKKIHSITALRKENKLNEAFSVFESLPAEIKDTRIMITIGISLVNISNNEQRYKQLLERLALNHSSDPAAAVMLIDYYFYQQKWDKVLSSIDAIESEFGEDGMLELLRANVYLSKNEVDRHIFHAERSINMDADLSDAYFSLSQGYINSNRYDDAINIFEEMIEKFNYQFNKSDFNKDPIYSSFIQSKEFKNWPYIQ